MCSMNGSQINNQFKSFAVQNCESTLSGSINLFRNFLSTIENRNLGDFLDQCSKSNNGLFDLSKNKTSNSYIERSHEIVAFLCANGRSNFSAYESVFELDMNVLYVVEDLSAKMQDPIIIQILDDLILFDYSVESIRSVLIRLFTFKLDNKIPLGVFSAIPLKCEMKDVVTPQYAQLLDFVDSFYLPCYSRNIFEDSETMSQIANFYFIRALESAGVKPFDFNPEMVDYIMRYVPFDRAVNAYYIDSNNYSQVLVEDSYVSHIGRTIRNGFDIPNQIHYAANNIGQAAASATACGDRILEISNILKTFTEAFVNKVASTNEKIDSATVVTLVEVFIDFVSDLKNLSAVPIGRWITYISRILRCFIPNCISLAIEFVNTYVISAVTAIAQGTTDFMTTVVTALVGVIAIGSVPTTKQTSKMVEYMKTINICVPFSKNIVAMMQNIIKMLPDCLKGWFSQFVPEHLFYIKLIAQYQEVLNSIDDFLAMDVDTIYFSMELQKQITRTYLLSHDLVRDMAPFIGDTSGQFSLLRERLHKFDKLYDSVTALQRCGITRACPFSLTIFGTSQIGKSTLSAAVAKYMFPSFLPDKVRYVIPADPDEFWNGYSALHPVTCEDDADQDAEYKAALRFFSIITNAPYQPPMASLDDVSVGKKGTPYHSKMHIRCTNVAYPNPTTKVLSKEAYWKRRHMLVEARVKADYMLNGKVQYDPLFKHLEFFEMDPVVESPAKNYIGDVMDFFDLLKSRYDRHMDNEERILRVMNATGSDFVKDLQQEFHRDIYTDAVAQGKLSEMLISATTVVTNRMQSTYNMILTYMEDLPVISRIAKVVGIVTALSGVVMSVFAIYGSLFSHDQEFQDKMNIFEDHLERFGSGEERDMVAEVIPSGDMRTSKYRKFTKRVAFAEGTSDASAESLTHDVIRGRQAFIKMTDVESKKTNSMCALFIGGRNLLVPYHFFIDSTGEMYKKNSRFVIETDCVVYEEMFCPDKVRQLVTKDGVKKDVSVYECSKRVKLYKDIRHHFISESDLANLNAWSECTLNKYRDCISERELTNCSTISNKQYKMWNTDEFVNLFKGFQYDAITVSGDCGSVLVLYNTRVRGKILGIHVAGERLKHHGYSELITREMLEKFDPKMNPAPLPNISNDPPGIPMAEGNYTLYGTVDRNEALYPISKTEIKPSLIHGKITKPITKPADLSKKNFSEAISKYFNQPLPLNPDVLPLLIEDQFETFSQMSRYNVGGCVSEDIAINGLVSIPYCDAMNMHTSPGLPYKLLHPGKGKHRYFDKNSENRYIVTDNVLRARIDHRIEMAKKGQLVDSIWVDIPKDERRKVGKQTRMIVIPPMDYTIVFRMYFMDFIVNFYNNHLKFYSAVGINPYSHEWTQMTNILLANSNFGGAGDWKQFDGKLMAELMDVVLQVVNRYYGEVVKETNHKENSLVREVLFEELIHTRTQCTNVLYCTHGGDPSGCPFTVILNTMANDMYFKVAWLMLAPPHLRSIKHFYDNVTLFVYGDDNIKSITGEVSSWYNEVTIRDHFANYGLVYTDASKVGEMVPIQPVESLTFLKNGIRRDGLIYHATMEEDTLYEMVNWIRESDDDYASTLVNCNMSLMMWYHYGKDRFEIERNRMLEALNQPSIKRGNIPRLLNYAYLHECFTDERMPEIDPAVAQGREDQTAGESNEQNVKEEINVASAVTFIEQKPSVVIDKDVVIKDESFLMHGDWNVQRMLSRPQRLGTYAFSTTDTAGTILKSFNLPQILNRMPGNYASILSAYTYIRYRPVFKIQLNGNKFTAGRLCVIITPWVSNNLSPIITLPDNLMGSTALEHAFLDASSNDVVTITAPWLCPHEYYNYALFTNANINNRYVHASGSTFYNVSSTHTLYLYVFNPLIVGTGAPTSINATVWLHLEDVHLSIPTASAATTQGGTHSYVTNNMQGWSKIASATLPTNIKGDTFDMNADLKLSTMDKPNDTLTPLYVVRRAMGYFGHCKNIEVLNRLALYPNGVSTSMPSDFGTDYDEMSLDYLCGKYTLFYKTSISTTQTTGTALTFCPITPYIYPLPNGGPSLTRMSKLVWNSTFDASSPMNLLGYVSLPFNFWTGSLKYRFDFITNAFVTAKVACSIIYGTSCPDTATAGIEPTSTLSYIFEVNADNKSFEIEVPYVADTPWKHVMNGQFVQGALATASVNSSFDDSVAYRCCTGQVALYVLNPLSVPSGLPTSYDINVFIAGGRDFQLNFISRANTAFFPVSQGNIDPNPGTQLSTLGDYKYKDNNCMSEKYLSIRDVMKRYAHVFTTVYNVAGIAETDQLHSASYFIPINQLVMPFFTGASASLNYASNIHNWYLALYRLWRGSLRVKILFSHWNETNTEILKNAISVDYIPSWEPLEVISPLRVLGTGANDESSGPNTTIGSLNTLTNTTHHGPRDISDFNANFHEIEIPQVHWNRTRPVPGIGSNGIANLDMGSNPGNRSNTYTNMVNDFGAVVINFPRTPDSYKVTTRVFLAFGDDFRAGGQMPTPMIKYGSAYETPLSTTSEQLCVNPDTYN